MQVYVFRSHGDTIEYKRTKCTNHWTKDKSICWKFNLRCGIAIASRYQDLSNGFYIYGVEEV